MATALTTELGAKTLRRLKVPDPLTPAQLQALQKQISWVEGADQALRYPRTHGLSLEQWRELAQRVVDVTARLSSLQADAVKLAARRAGLVLRGAKFPKR